jgi:hypothetical protein
MVLCRALWEDEDKGEETHHREKCITHCARNIKLENMINRKKKQKRNDGMKCELMIEISLD